MKRLYKPDPIPKAIEVPPLVRVPYHDEALKQKQAAKMKAMRAARLTEEERQAANDRRLLKQVAKMLGKA
jgi:hypothetical protein